MNPNSQLELSLEESLEGFGVIVRTLLKSFSLEDAFPAAQHAAIASIGLMKFYDEDSSNGREFNEEATVYTDLIRLCLGKFQEMLNHPEANGQRKHLDLYREQMEGRIKLINRMYSERN